MKFLSYGEDALTLWALTENLSYFLAQLNDSSDPENALVFYRPSFGRRSGSESKPRSEFGEFDAIIGTTCAVYLIETKWSGSSEFKSSGFNGNIILRPEQRRRHQIFHWYLNEWRTSNSADWKSFKERMEIAHSQQFKHSVLPLSDSALASNLEFLLSQLKPCNALIQDVLLFIRIDEKQIPLSVEPAQFKLVTMSPKTVGGAGYIQLFKPSDPSNIE